MDEYWESEIVRGDSDGSVGGVLTFSLNSLAEPLHILRFVDVILLNVVVLVEVVGDFLPQLPVLSYLSAEADAGRREEAFSVSTDTSSLVLILGGRSPSPGNLGWNL